MVYYVMMSFYYSSNFVITTVQDIMFPGIKVLLLELRPTSNMSLGVDGFEYRVINITCKIIHLNPSSHMIFYSLKI